MRAVCLIFFGLLFITGMRGIAPSVCMAQDFRPLESVMSKAVADSVFPGASLAVVYRDRLVFHKAFGKMTYDHGSAPAETSTIYDLASLTKAVATTSIVMQLVERDSLDLQAPVSRYLPGFAQKGKQKVTIEQLLRHTSGLRAHTFFSKECRTPDELFAAIERDTLLSAPGSTTLYSDLGFMLLGRIIEKLTGRTMSSNFHERFAVPLGMSSTMFNPPASLLPRIAPVETDTLWRSATRRPLVHDQNAALLQGEAGHAGLFSTTGDLVIMVKMLMNNGSLNGHTYINGETVRKFVARTKFPRAIGWDMTSPGNRSSAGDHFSASAYGHLGYTGTSIWIDPEKDLAVILLSNRVYPTSANIRIRAFRPLLHNTVIECLELQGGK